MLCAGMDIEELYKPEKGRFKFQDIFGELYGSSYPTAAVINVYIYAYKSSIVLSTFFWIDWWLSLRMNPIDMF